MSFNTLLMALLMEIYMLMNTYLIKWFGRHSTVNPLKMALARARDNLPPLGTALATQRNIDFLRYGRLIAMQREEPCHFTFNICEAFSWPEHVGDSPDAVFLQRASGP
jgi:hypothetical protein